ncbi:MAG: PAS domain S-box protein, partial [Candidatus Zixiibacteriota bacterium]
MKKAALPINRRIIIIDDNPDIHQDLYGILNVNPSGAFPDKLPSLSAPDGHRIDSAVCPQFQLESAYQGEEGYLRIIEEEIAGNPFSLAFIADRMPTGLDSIQTIRKIWADIPDLELVLCMATSGYSYDRIVAMLGTCEQLSVIRKPFDPLEVRQLAESLTRKWSFRNYNRRSYEAFKAEAARQIYKLENANRALQAELISSRREQASLCEDLDWQRLLFNGVDDPILVHNIDQQGNPSKYIEINDAACRLFRYAREEFLHRSPEDVLKPPEAGHRMTIRKKLLVEKQAIFRCIALTRDNREIPLELNSRLIESKGRLVVLSVARDITDRSEAKCRCHDLEEKYRSFLNSANDIIYTCSPEAILTSVSPSFEVITGWPAEEWLGKPFTPLIHPDDLPQIRARFERVMRGESVPVYVVRFLAKSGEYRYAELTSTPHILDGKVIGLFGIARDVSERKRAEQQIENLARFPNENPNPVLRIREDGTLLYVNEAGKPILEANHWKVGDSVLDQWSWVMGNAKNSRATKEIELSCGEKVYSLFFAPIDGADYINIYGIDITEHARAEQQRRNMEKKLERAERMESLAVLAGGVAHDLNNILGPLVGYPELMQSKLPQESPIRSMVDMLGKSARDASNVIQDLLTLARRGRYELSPVNLNGVIESYLKSAAFQEL